MADINLTPTQTFNSGDTVFTADLNKLAQSNVALTAGTIVAGDIAADAVTTVKILDDNVTTEKIADDNVTTEKIADDNVTTEKIADDNVTTAKILDANVTTSKIADANVTAVKLDGVAKDGGGVDIAVGTAPVFGCRAWVNFDGTKDTTQAASTANTNRLIRASGNVTSVLRNGTGDYTITFTTAMVDANYVATAMGLSSTGGYSVIQKREAGGSTESVVRVISVGQSSGFPAAVDRSDISVAIFR